MNFKYKLDSFSSAPLRSYRLKAVVNALAERDKNSQNGNSFIFCFFCLVWLSFNFVLSAQFVERELILTENRFTHEFAGISTMSTTKMEILCWNTKFSRDDISTIVRKIFGSQLSLPALFTLHIYTMNKSTVDDVQLEFHWFFAICEEISFSWNWWKYE